jgi:radical SAM superfamily enzyme YgiQ (UPF0313 family)
MKLTLINCDFPSVTAVPPLGVLSLAQVAQNVGYKITIRDYQLADVQGSRAPKVFAEFCDTSDEVLGVSVSGFSLPLVILGLQEVKKKRPEQIIVMGGIGASGAAEEIMNAFDWINILVYGEGEDTFKELLEALKNKTSLQTVNGLLYRKNGHVVKNPKRQRIDDLEKLGKLDFSFLDMSQYNLVNLILGRGCPYPCTFCDVAPYWERKNVVRPMEFLISEIEEISKKVKPGTVFVFVDDTLTISRERTEILCKHLGPDNLNIEWACYARANDLDEDLVKLMGTSGCKKIYLGIESGSDKILKLIRKGFDSTTAWKSAVMAKKYIPHVQAAFVWGFPEETWDDFNDTLLMMGYLVSKDIGAKANILTPLPFSSQFKDMEKYMVFMPEYSPQFHLAQYDLDSEIVKLIKQYPRIFPCFFTYFTATLKEKYNLLRKMKLSPEDIWDIWLEAKGPAPTRVRPKEITDGHF